MASRQLVYVDTDVSVPIKLRKQCFNEKFLVLKSAISLVLGIQETQHPNMPQEKIALIFWHDDTSKFDKGNGA